MNPRSGLAWLLKYGITGFGLRMAARSGELAARVAVDPTLRANPFPAYDDIRAMGPLVKGRFVSATANYATCNELLRSELFHASPASTPFKTLQRLRNWAVTPDTTSPVDPPSLLATNGVDHARMRKLAAHAFTPRAVNALATRIDDLAHSMLDTIAADKPKTFDLIETYASILPVTVIADILGVPAGMRRQFLSWVNDAAMSLEPGLSWRDYQTTERAMRQVIGWFDGHVERLRRNPGDDLLSRMIEAVDGSDRFTHTELMATALLTLGAGFETTVNLIGNAVALLMEHPEQLERLKAEPDGWPNAVEEVLRYESPVQVTVRLATADTTVAGKPVSEGELVIIMIGGANRDPANFADPHTFDTARANAREHIAFSAGAHYCLGAQLARLEGATALRALFERFPDLEPGGVPVRRGTRVLRGYKRLPLTGLALQDAA